MKKTGTKRYKYTTVRQWEGNDGYCWAVFLKTRPEVPVVSGLTRREVSYYRDKIEKQEADKEVKK